MWNLTLVVATSNETVRRAFVFGRVCTTVRCIFITNHRLWQLPHEQIVVNHKCANGLSAYLMGNARYLEGYAAARSSIRTAWILMVDDDTRVHLASGDFLTRFDASQSHYFADFEDMGSHGTFACGGGGFLMSRSLFSRIDFRSCSNQHVCSSRSGSSSSSSSSSHSAHSKRIYGDHSLHACIGNMSHVHYHKEFVCGTCGNHWGAAFTRTRLQTRQCLFMHNQRSHNPGQYAELVRAHPPLVLHRPNELFGKK